MAIPKAEITGKRLRAMVEAGAMVFCRQGYERSQVADVAKAMGVAVGTVYSYVEGKEALFDLVIRYSSVESDEWLDGLEIPVKTPPAGSTLKFIQAAFERTEWPVLQAALAKKKAKDPAAELDGVLREQYGLMRRHRRALLLLMKSALEYPGLLDAFVFGLRAKLLDHLVRYIGLRVKAGQFREPEDVFATAAVLTQTIAWANLQRPFDPGLATMTETSSEEATLGLLVAGLILK